MTECPREWNYTKRTNVRPFCARPFRIAVCNNYSPLNKVKQVSVVHYTMDKLAIHPSSQLSIKVSSSQLAVIKVVDIKVAAIKAVVLQVMATKVTEAVEVMEVLAHATIPFIVGPMAAAVVPVVNASTNTMVIKTMPLSRIKRGATPEIVNDSLGRRMEIIQQHTPEYNVRQKVIDPYPLSTNPPNIIAKADSGASSHYFKSIDKKVLADLRATPFGSSVMLPV
jgi:uncharacterized integral membrane protein